ncbi:MAG: Flp pilus assembly protein CpaB [Firmicutes bacterium]|nr:Flp pilus assembly protein CpaB [Bacillota bacterium]
MARLSGKGLFIIAVILSLVSATLVYNYLQKASVKAPKPGLPVVVAKVDILPKTKITADMIQEVNVPEEYIQPGAVQGIDNAVGVLVREPIVAGEQITAQRLVVAGKAGGFSGSIPRNMRAVTVSVTEVTGVAGFVKPGDNVDLIATFDQSAVGEDASRIILQNVEVLAVDREPQSGVVVNPNAEANKGKQDVIRVSTVTLAVTPEEATRLTVAEEKGKIRLALRSYMPGDGLVLTGTVTPRDLIGSRYKAETPVVPAPSAPPSLPQKPSGGIQLIRGTKVETVPLH